MYKTKLYNTDGDQYCDCKWGLFWWCMPDQVCIVPLNTAFGAVAISLSYFEIFEAAVAEFFEFTWRSSISSKFV